MKIDATLKKELKSQGYLPSRDGEHVAVRVITGNGTLSTEEMAAVSKSQENTEETKSLSLPALPLRYRG